MIYRRTGDLRAVQLLLGHTKIESTVRYLGIDSTMRSPLRSRSRFRRSGWLVAKPPSTCPLAEEGPDPGLKQPQHE
jgi:hypothetical protein